MWDVGGIIFLSIFLFGGGCLTVLDSFGAFGHEDDFYGVEYDFEIK